MVKREGDKTPTPPGGRAAERLKQFEDARRPYPEKGEDTGASGGPPEQLPEQDECPPEANEDVEKKTTPPST
jgi:hypothetical protein